MANFPRTPFARVCAFHVVRSHFRSCFPVARPPVVKYRQLITSDKVDGSNDSTNDSLELKIGVFLLY
jgi:hypothetical protein